MSAAAVDTSLDNEVRDWLYREAELLDNGLERQWLEQMVSRDIVYQLPLRQTVERARGAGWVEGGRADLTMVRPIFVGDFVSSRTFVKGKELLVDGSVRLVCEAWVESQTGEKKVAGTVSGIVR